MNSICKLVASSPCRYTATRSNKPIMHVNLNHVHIGGMNHDIDEDRSRRTASQRCDATTPVPTSALIHQLPVTPGNEDHEDHETDRPMAARLLCTRLMNHNLTNCAQFLTCCRTVITVFLRQLINNGTGSVHFIFLWQIVTTSIGLDHGISALESQELILTHSRINFSGWEFRIFPFIFIFLLHFPPEKKPQNSYKYFRYNLLYNCSECSR